MSKKENGQNAIQEKKEEKEEKNDEKKEIEKIKADVDRLSQDLKTAVSELKKSIVDIRSAVSEIENPFNLLRAVSSEKDLKKLNHERLPPGVKSLVIGKAEEETETAEEKPVIPAVPEEMPETKPQLAEKAPPKPEFPPSGTVYLDWVWSLLDLGFTPDDVKLLAQSYEHLGFLPENSSGQIYSLAVAAEKAKSKGLSKGRLLLNMYKASVASGIKIGLNDMRLLISIAEGKMKKAKRVA
ncbi:MAG: hypothetical protein QXV21_06535 [Candidatus Bathyarchaeia archaeon]